MTSSSARNKSDFVRIVSTELFPGIHVSTRQSHISGFDSYADPQALIAYHLKGGLTRESKDSGTTTNLTLRDYIKTIDGVDNNSWAKAMDSSYYLLSGASHHLIKLLEGISKNMTGDKALQEALKNPKITHIDKFIYSVNHELDAFLSAVRRAMDIPVRILGRALLNKSMPKSIFRIIKASSEDKLTREYFEILKSDLDNWMPKARAYRVCMEHYAEIPIRFTLSKNEKDIIDSKFYLPDNPETNSSSKFQYNEKIKADEYCWKLFDNVVRLTYKSLLWIANKKFGELPILNSPDSKNGLFSWETAQLGSIMYTVRPNSTMLEK